MSEQCIAQNPNVYMSSQFGNLLELGGYYKIKICNLKLQLKKNVKTL